MIISLNRLSEPEWLRAVHLPPVHVLMLTGLLCFVGGAYLHFLPPHKKSWTRQYVMPPGPRAIPVLGSLVSWLRAHSGGTMISWLIDQAQYGEMTTLSMGSKTWVLLNTPESLNEILSKRASCTSERPYLPITGGLVSHDKSYFLLPTSDLHDGQRLIHRLLLGGISSSKNEAGDMSSTDRIIDSASLQLLKSYLDDPTKWYQHNYRYATAIIYKLVTGTELKKSTAELDEFQHVASTFLLSINSHLVDFFPQLAKLVPVPLQFWRAKWVALGRWQHGVMKRWWQDILSSTPTASDRKGNEQLSSSFVQDVLASEYANVSPSSKSQPANPAELAPKDERAMYLTLFLLAAGADNPRMTLNAFLMACLSYPEVMQRARKELDQLCGYTPSIDAPQNSNKKLRLPTLKDIPSLPYISAIVKEVLRWRPTVPLMPQRVATRDLDVRLNRPGGVHVSYNFPKGTEFLVNTIAVCNNVDGYTSPEKFIAERWLPVSNPDAEDDRMPRGRSKGVGGSYNGIDPDFPWQFAFSAGKRSCTGYRLAQKEIFLAVARLLFCFEFRVRDTDAGRNMEKELDDMALNAFSLGEPFPIHVGVRSVEHERLIRDSAIF